MAGIGNPNWKPGVSGNPGGRTANPIKVLARKNSKDAFAVLLGLLKSKNEQTKKDAAIEILNRAWGRPTQAVIGGDEDDPPLKGMVEVFIRPV